MRHRAHPESDRPLLLTLVVGLAGEETTGVARALSGRDPATGVGDEIGDGGDDSGEFALRLAEELAAEADRGMHGDIVVELEPRADIVEIGLILETVFAQRPPGERVILIRDLITVSSVESIRHWFFGAGPRERDEDDYESAERLATQLEFATTVVLTDAAGAEPDDLQQSLALVSRLNPTGQAVPLAWTRTRRPAFRPVEGGVARSLGRNMGWQLELAGRVRPMPRMGAIEALVYREPMPFHPERLWLAVHADLVPEEVGTILRSRGLVKLATRPDRVGAWMSAGGVLTIEPTSMLSWDLESPLGQELVFFGRDLDRDRLVRVLDSCLVTPAELMAGRDVWARFEDPFPEWSTQHHH
jgi:G3E family GTPase